MTRRELLSAVREACQAAAAEGSLPALLGELEVARVEALAGLQAARGRPRVLTVEETAAALGRSVSWIYKNKANLPVVPLPGGVGWGVSEKKLEQLIDRRTR